MKRPLRIVFMGTPMFAVGILSALIDAGHNIVGVVTAPDKPAGRGQKPKPSDVKTYAESKGLKIFQPTNLKDPAFLAALKSLDANLQIVVAFRMLPEAVWKMPEYGTFNLHASLLPEYRGAAPIHWAIINGETKTGVTTFFIDEKIDTGAIILQKETAIDTDETTGSLHDRLMQIGSQLVIDTVKLIAQGNVRTIVQPKESIVKMAPKLHKDNTKIDWQQTIDHIYNQIRGLDPFPSAWSHLINEGKTITVKIFGAEKLPCKHSDTTGSILATKSEIKVAVNGGYILVKEMQLPGKRKMDSRSLLNGYHFFSDAKMC